MGFFSAIAPSIIGGVASLVGADWMRDASRDANRRNEALQREFAVNGLRWRVADAEAAGLHPLAGIGAQISPASPSFVAGDHMGQELSRMGQDISRMVWATKTETERKQKLIDLQLERGSLENDLLRTQIINARRQTGPAFPGEDLGIHIPGQPDSSTGGTFIEQVPVRRTASIPGAPYADAGHVADFSFARTPYGLAVVPSKDVKERVEDQLVPETMWAVRNSLMPNLPGNFFPVPSTRDFPIPPEARRKGYNQWKWSYSLQQFVPSRGSRWKDFMGGD